MDDIILLIPALDPPMQIFENYIKELKELGFNNILVINDGSDVNYDDFFNKLKTYGVDIYTHHKNLGKGRALKNAFNYILENYPSIKYTITADSDGQHKASDVLNIAQIIHNNNKKALYLGSRDFNSGNVPFKSEFGNKLTSLIYRIFFNDYIKDTQTGLRAIPREFFYDYMDLNGERFEYEINMLINSSNTHKDIIEIPIETIYLNDNSATHFHPVKDSMRIYRVIFKSFFLFILSAISSRFVDIGFFSLFIRIFKNIIGIQFYLILISTFLARIISGIYNYKVNKNLVFNDSKNNKQYIKYIILRAVQLFISSVLVDYVFSKVSFDISFVKIIVDTVLFIVSFQIQRRYIFNEVRA